MATITEMGFSISHEFEGGIATNSLKTTTVREWLGETQGSNIIKITGGEGGYQNIVVAGKTYADAKITSQRSDYD